jgi:hypothetical protein
MQKYRVSSSITCSPTVRYKRIVNRIKDNSLSADWKVAKRLLGWMVCVKRQLTWKEMQVALSIDTNSQTIEYDDCHLRTHIQDICGSLVLMLGDRVTLVHSTAKTYVSIVPDQTDIGRLILAATSRELRKTSMSRLLNVSSRSYVFNT